MMLNFMWGKFGQKPNKTQVKEFDDPVLFHQFHDSDKYDIRYVSVLTEQRVEVHYKHQLQDDPGSPNLNIFIACFTTCHARLKLYEQLSKLKERVLYFDTDSIIFKSSPGDEPLQLGEYLGDFKNEVNEGTPLSNLLQEVLRIMAMRPVKANKNVKSEASRSTAKEANNSTFPW